jgi:WD40 repeat protein/DNA-binding SARP family transcriptional activator
VSRLPGFEFRVLGPLEVWVHGRPVRLAGERQRTLLALFLLQPNEVVSADRLIEGLFGGERSEGASNALQVAISRLRRVLSSSEADAGAMLVTRSQGYELRVEPGRIDAVQFELLVAEGRGALAVGDARLAARRLHDALALWRGPPLADLSDADVLQREIRRLEELRLAALSDRVEADLALGASAELVGELVALLEAHPRSERLCRQLMLALYRAGRQADALEVYRSVRRQLHGELGLEPGRELRDLERAILRQDRDLDIATADLGSPRPVDAVVVCPFKGLASYGQDDSDYFFGRERAIADLIARVAGGGLVGIVGASGAGKSSLLRAGLLPALARGALPGSDRWRAVVIRPGTSPRAELTRVLDEDTSSRAVRTPIVSRVVVAIDQLEEVFAAGVDPVERSAFLEALADAALDPDGHCVVVVTVRADLYGRCAEHPRFAQLVSTNHLLLGPMERDELARAIELPAQAVGLEAEQRLVDVLVHDIADAPGALPLLSTMLLELWRRREGSFLLLEHYRSAGGVRGAVARLGEQAYRGLSEPDQQIARSVFLRLVDERDGTLLRRRVRSDTLDGDALRIAAVLADARLLTLAEGTVEVSHEALLTEWPRIGLWLAEDRDDRRARAHLASSSVDWDARGRDAAELYRGARLASAVDWAGDHAAELSELETEFIAASRQESVLELNRERRHNRRLRMLLAGVATLLVGSVAAGAVALSQRSSARRQGRIALARQLGAQAIVEPRIDLAMLLAREAVNLGRSRQIEGTLLSTLERAPHAIGTFTVPITDRPQAVAVSPDGRTIAVATNNDVMRFYDTRTHRQTHTARMTQGSYAYVPRTNLLIAAPPGPLPYELIDGRTDRVLQRFQLGKLWNTQLSGFVEPLLTTPDGRYVFLLWAIQHSDGSYGHAYIQRWAVAQGGAPRVTPMRENGMIAATITPDDTLVAATESAISTWNTRTLARIRTVAYPRPRSSLVDGAISPDGRTFAYGLADGTMHFVDVASGRVGTGLGAHAAPVQHVVFSPDSRLAVSTGDDGAAIVWNPATRTPVEHLIGHDGRVLSAAFSIDGASLYTASLDGTVLQWDLGGGRSFGEDRTVGVPSAALAPTSAPAPVLALAPDGRTFAVRASPSSIAFLTTSTLRAARAPALALPARIEAAAWAGSRLAVGSQHGTISIWDVARAHGLVRTLHGLTGVIRALATSAGGRVIAAVDGKRVGAGREQGSLAVWRDGRLLYPPKRLDSFGNDVTFSRDGSTLAVATDDGRVLVLDARSGSVERTLHPATGSSALAFAPDGTLASGSWAGIVTLWNSQTGALIGHPTLVAAAPVAAIAFDSTGDIFATAGGPGGGVKLWSTSTLQQFGGDLPTADTHWARIAFTPDGRSLLAVFDDGTAHRWPITVSAWERHACAVAGRNLTHEEWARFVSGRSYAKTCPSLPAG